MSRPDLELPLETALPIRRADEDVRLSIVIVNWNTRDLLADCLASILEAEGRVPFEVIVVDNDSYDGSAALVRERFPDVTLIENAENSGFAQANNVGISRSCGQFVLLLNADTLVARDALDTLLAYLEGNPDMGAVGPFVANPDGSLQVSCYPMPTLFRETWRLFHLDRLRPLGSYAMDAWDRSTPRPVDVLLGACILMRREALEEVGLLRESYFMYSEDLDICYRLQQAGWGVAWEPRAGIIHYGGSSTQQVSRKMFLQLYLSKLEFFRIYYGPFRAFLYRLVLIAAALGRLALVPLGGLLRLPGRASGNEFAGNYRRLIKSLLTG